MNRHQKEIESIIAQVEPWPVEDQIALAQALLRKTRRELRVPVPRHVADQALGIARGTGPTPDDATIKQWIAEHRQRKYG